MNGFCVECGKEIEHGVHGLCMECFLKDRQLISLPAHVDLTVCSNCGEFFTHGEWAVMRPEDAISNAVRDEVTAIKEARITGAEVTLVPLDDFNYSVTLTCQVDIDGYQTGAAATTVLRIKNGVCKRCSRKTGQYYEAILQIRGREKKLDPVLQDEVLARVENYVDGTAERDRDAFITKMELVPGGVDVYLSQISLGRALVKMLGDDYCAQTDEAAKLVGQTADGLDMYRVNYLVRLPEFHVGDVVFYQKHYYKLFRVNSAGGRLVSLKNFREMPVRRADMPELRVYAKRADLEEANVISRSPGEIQIMDPQDYSTVDLLVPPAAKPGDKVQIIRIDDVLYYVPE